jgi:Tfp pilus assembly protein PilN
MVSFTRRGTDEATDAPSGTIEQAAPVAAPEAPASAPLAAFPRVNLIPEQIAREARTRTAKRVFVGAIAASVVVVGGLYLMSTMSVSSAQSQLDAATSQSAALAAESAKYADVPRVNSELQTVLAQQVQAMAGEVRWSTVLNNLALSLPEGVALSSFRGTVSGLPTPGGGAASGTPAATSVLGTPGIGTLSYQGEATDDSRVAAFLDAVSKNAGVLDPFVTQSALSSAASGGSTQVSFTATATIGTKALSHRYDGKGN